MRKSAFFAVLVMAFVFLPLIASGQTPVKVGYVDLQKVMMESDKGKEARKSLTDEVEKLKKNLNQKQEELQKMKDALEKQTAMITPEARAEKEKQYQAKLKDYQRVANDYQTELQQKDQEFTQKILKDLEDIIKRTGEGEKYTLILEKSQAGILYGATSADVTDKVIAMYNESSKKKAAAPKK
ncbi:MAG: periplasmic chaperone [Syntrophorhabdaceae bacterium PtaU1.Bin034]|jgi:outer membrane protein|nr:MAG: periplasmic chaperone [Syntrophorhabdaceae bacterium PtaU1.Bin034]